MLDANSTNSSSSNSNISNIFGIIPPGPSAGARVRTETERAEFLARIKAKTASDFAVRDKEIQGKKGRQETADQKKAKRLADALLRAAKQEALVADEDDGTDTEEDVSISIADIDIDADGNEYRRDTGGDAGDEAEDDEVADAWTDDLSDVDEVFKALTARGRADRWGYRPALGFENGVPLGATTADICDQGPGRMKGKAEMARADEARAFQKIRQAYPIDGYDYKILCFLCDPSLSKKQIADKLGRDPRAIRYAAKRIREQFATGRFHTRRGGGATGVNMDDRVEVGAWLAQPLPKAASGRKKKGAIVRTPKKIRIPARLKLAPLVAVMTTRVPRPYKPRRPRARFVDPGQVDMFYQQAA